jgi:hypothetical protein
MGTKQNPLTLVFPFYNVFGTTQSSLKMDVLPFLLINNFSSPKLKVTTFDCARRYDYKLEQIIGTLKSSPSTRHEEHGVRGGIAPTHS